MSKKIDFKLNSAGVRQLLQGPQMQKMIDKKIRMVSSRAGEGFSSDVRVGKFRVWGVAKADTSSARKKCLKENVLIKALGSSK